MRQLEPAAGFSVVTGEEKMKKYLRGVNQHRRTLMAKHPMHCYQFTATASRSSF